MPSNSTFAQNSNSIKTLLFNALFLLCLVFMGYADPMAVVFAYVFETIIIGFVHFIKIFYVIKYNEPEKGQSKALSYMSLPFFLIHYGFFVTIQSIIIYTGFAINDERFSTSLRFSNFTDIFNLEGFKVVAVSIVLTHIISFYFSFYKNKKYNNQQLEVYFLKPYLRIFLQQILAIVPFFFLIYFNEVGIIAAILLISIRTALDYYMISISENPEKLKK